MNELILVYIYLTLLGIISFSRWAYLIFSRGGWNVHWMALTLFLFIIGVVCGFKGSLQRDDKHHRETYAAWVKHTKNPNHLTLDEWKALNRNYVPRGKYDRRKPEL